MTTNNSTTNNNNSDLEAQVGSEPAKQNKLLPIFATVFVLLAIGTSFFLGIEYHSECGIVKQCPNGATCFENTCLFETSNVSFAKDDTQYDDTVGSFWKQSTVPFIIDSNLTISQKLTITKGIKTFINLTRFKLIPKTNESDYLIFTSDADNGCSSFLGRLSGWQKIFIGTECGEGTVQHEIMHALGWDHEQSRKDRDTYVDILKENIDIDIVHNFDKSIDNLVWNSIEQYTDYDFDSIMHYSSGSLSKNKQQTILTKSGDYIPKNMKLSKTDLLELQMYSDISNKL